MITRFSLKGIILDLEMNQPSGRIIQIGAVLCDYKAKRIVDEFNQYCLLPKEETLDPFIAKLCGIEEVLLKETGVELADAAAAFWQWLENCKCGFHLGAWGSDVYELKKQSQQLGVSVPTRLKSLNIKEMGVLWRMAKGGKSKGGLLNTMTLFGLPFDGRQHCALADSKNTASLVFKWCKMQESYLAIEKLVKPNS